MDGFAGSLDDSISAASTSDVQDRLSALESRVQQQEDEITVLKAALADVLRRLAISEDHVASVKKSMPSKGQPSLREAISMSCITNGSGKDMSIIQWKLVEKLPVPQNEVITDASVTKTPASSSETARPSNSPPLPPSLPLTGTAEEESRMGSSPTLVENSLEQIAEPSEEQSEWGSEDLGVVIDEEPASELSETQGATELPEEERGITPLC